MSKCKCHACGEGEAIVCFECATKLKDLALMTGRREGYGER